MNKRKRGTGTNGLEGRVLCALLALIIDRTAPDLFSETGEGVDPSNLTVSELGAILDHFDIEMGDLVSMLIE